jgi:hypothetical protein
VTFMNDLRKLQVLRLRRELVKGHLATVGESEVFQRVLENCERELGEQQEEQPPRGS